MLQHLSMTAALVLASTPALSSVVVIDDFITQQSFTVGAGTPFPQTGGNVVNPTASAIGSERDLWLRKVAGLGGAAVGTSINPFGQNLLRFDQGAGVRGSARITWDGVDNNPDAIAYQGLGADFGLRSSGHFELLLSFNNILGPIEFAVYDGTDPTGSRHATGFVNVPAGIDIDVSMDPPMSLLLNFADMTLQNSATDAMFRTVGAITMTINAEASGQGGRDVNIDLLRAWIEIPTVSTVPVPGVALLLLPGLLGLALRSRRIAAANA